MEHLCKGRLGAADPVVAVDSTLAAIAPLACPWSFPSLRLQPVALQRQGGSIARPLHPDGEDVPATLLVIPLFGIFRSLGPDRQLWSLVLAHATLIIPFTTWMLKGYFDTIPRELEQASDGRRLLSAWRPLPRRASGRNARACSDRPLCIRALLGRLRLCPHFLTNAQGSWTANLGNHHDEGRVRHDWNEISAAAVFVAVPIILIYLFLDVIWSAV